MIVDEVVLKISAGKGGDGVVRWRREKYVPKGGPAGGNGGDGGDFYVEAVSDISYLNNYRFEKEFKAQNGVPGGDRNREGARGEDFVLKVPVGSVITDIDTGEAWDLKKVGERVLLAKGGRGGLGNTYFKSSTNTTPYEWTPGKPGEKRTIKIELKMIADIGLIGLPNAGKSTLLNLLTSAKSKIGAYAFTTLEPHLGVTKSGLILADIPGLIEGASEGKGLGHKFLKHIERTRVLVHLVSCENEDVVSAYEEIRNELEKYGSGLSEKDEIIVLSKIDESDEADVEAKAKALKSATAKDIIQLSAFDDVGVKKLSAEMDRLAQKSD